jgi:hypothetical protein
VPYQQRGLQGIRHHLHNAPPAHLEIGNDAVDLSRLLEAFFA